jgi:hypothetical protein
MPERRSLDLDLVVSQNLAKLLALLISCSRYLTKMKNKNNSYRAGDGLVISNGMDMNAEDVTLETFIRC